MGHTVAIIQARATSSRLPNKIYADIAGHPLLWHVITRTQRAQTVDLVVVAVPHGTPILVGCGLWYFGPEEDVLARYYGAAEAAGADTIVRITGDCPLVSPWAIDEVVKFQRDSKLDYACNTQPPSYPDGLDVEVFSRSALRMAHQNANRQSDREHVSPWMWRNCIRRGALSYYQDWSEYRLCIDEQADLDLMRAIFAEFDPTSFDFGDAVNLLQQRPDLQAINGHLKRNASYLAQVEGEQQS